MPAIEIFLCSAGTLELVRFDVLSTIYSCPTTLCSLNLEKALLLYQKITRSDYAKSLINSAHDVSDGGIAVTIAESIIGSGLGANIEIEAPCSSIFNLTIGL